MCTLSSIAASCPAQEAYQAASALVFDTPAHDVPINPPMADIIIDHADCGRPVDHQRAPNFSNAAATWCEMRNAFGLSRLMRVQEAHLLHSRCWKSHLSMHHCAP